MGECGLGENFLVAPENDWIELITGQPDRSEDWKALARRGGSPTPALELQPDEDRTIWFDGYVRTYLKRDLQALPSISALPDFPRLKRAACLRMAQLVNQTELCRDVALLQLSVHCYLNLLETFNLLVRLPAVAVNCTRHPDKVAKVVLGRHGRGDASYAGG